MSGRLWLASTKTNIALGSIQEQVACHAFPIIVVMGGREASAKAVASMCKQMGAPL
jgi:hypothetical protein